MRTVRRWVDHTSELELELEARTAEGVFAEAAAALAELYGGGADPAGTRTVEVEAGDRAALLAAFMEELVYLADAEGLVPVDVPALELGARSACAVVALAHGDPPPLVKAVTYHRLAFEPHAHGYRARTVLDV